MYIFSREVLKDVPGPPQGCPEVALGRPEGGPGSREGAWQPMGNLDLRFPMIWARLSIWTYVFQ